MAINVTHRMFWKKEHKSTPIVVDIGSREVKVLVYTYDDKTGNIMIEGVGTSSLEEDTIEHGQIQNRADVVRALETAYIEAKKSDDEISMVIGTSGILSDTIRTTMTEHREKPNKAIRPKEWENLLEHTHCRVEEEEYHSQLLHNMPMELVQSSIEGLTIDGEPHKDPLGQTGEKLEMNLFNTYVPESLTKELTAIAETVNVPIEGMFHTSYAVSRLVVDNHHDPHVSMVLIDVGETHTDVTVVENGLVRDTTSFSVGGRDFTETIMTAFEATSEEAEILKREYSKAQLPRKLAQKITDVLTEDIKLWLHGVQVTLEQYPSDFMIPQHFVLCGGSSKLMGLQEALEYGNWYENVNLHSKPSVSVFYPKTLPHIVDTTDKLNHPKFIPLIGLIHASSSLTAQNTFGFHKLT